MVDKMTAQQVDNKCLWLIDSRLCGINKFPERGSYAFKDLNPDLQKIAVENRGYIVCQSGMQGCRPKYSQR
jgi:hypothetical protein